MISRGLSSPLTLRTLVRIFGESRSPGLSRSSKDTELFQLRVTVSSSRKGRIASGLSEKTMADGKIALPSSGIVVLVGEKELCAQRGVNLQCTML
jgi:hypothetical protein